MRGKATIQGALAVVAMFALAASTQGAPVKGVVKDAATGLPLSGVTVQVKGTSNSTTTDANGRFSLSIDSPDIATPPASQTVTAGQTATFTVEATGASPLAYRWQTNSMNIAGATNASYTTPATTLADSGKVFRVIITNSFGSVTSSVATLTVLPPDNTPPTVSLTAPANGATVSNTVTVSATATDNVAVAGVQFKLDGASNLGAEDTGSPFSISWDTTGAANGIHALTAVARDTAGNLATSVFFTVTVTNAGGSIMGNNGGGSQTDNISDGLGSYITASRFLAASSFTATSIKAKVLGITGKYKCAIYSDNGSVPQALLKVTDEATNPSTGWQTFALTSSQTIQGGSYYWLAIWSDLHSTSAGVYCDATGGSTRWTGVVTYGTWPDPISITGGGSSVRRYCIYAESSAGGEVLVNGIPSSWLIQYFGSTNGVNGHAQEDWDQDGMNNYAEWKAGTCPTNAASRFQVSGFRCQDGTNLLIQWTSETGKYYTVQATTNLLTGFGPIPGATNIPATYPVNVYTDDTTTVGQKFYRIRVATPPPSPADPLWSKGRDSFGRLIVDSGALGDIIFQNEYKGSYPLENDARGSTPVDRVAYDWNVDGYDGQPLGSYRNGGGPYANLDLAHPSWKDGSFRNVLVKNWNMKNAYKTIPGPHVDVTQVLDSPGWGGFFVVQDATFKNSDDGIVQWQFGYNVNSLPAYQGKAQSDFGGVVVQGVTVSQESAFIEDATARVALNGDSTVVQGNYLGSWDPGEGWFINYETIGWFITLQQAWTKIIVIGSLPDFRFRTSGDYAFSVATTPAGGQPSAFGGQVFYYPTIEDALAAGHAEPPFIRLSRSGWAYPATNAPQAPAWTPPFGW